MPVILFFFFNKGMEELHKTSVNCHGNLKSTNVLIDSYWICKVADHGLHNFRENKLLAEESPQAQSGEVFHIYTEVKTISRIVSPIVTVPKQKVQNLIWTVRFSCVAERPDFRIGPA